MFSDGFEAVGYTAHNSEREPSLTEKTLNVFKAAMKDKDWRLVINILEDWPETANLAKDEQQDLLKALGRLRSLMGKRREEGKTFSSESLSDLSSELEQALTSASHK